MSNEETITLQRLVHPKECHSRHKTDCKREVCAVFLIRNLAFCYCFLIDFLIDTQAKLFVTCTIAFTGCPLLILSVLRMYTRKTLELIFIDQGTVQWYGLKTAKEK